MATDLIKLDDAFITLNVQVVPKSSVEKIDGTINDAGGNSYFKIRINAPAEDGKANKALINFLSRQLKLAKSAISISSGEKSRRKVIKITASAEEKLRILAFISNFK